MPTRTFLLPLLAVAWVASGASGGETRTDGPEGSEVGQGGYTSPTGGGTLGLELRFGGLGQRSNTVDYASTAPLFAGAAVSYWYWDWLSLDLEANYAFGNHRFNALLGPRFRTGWFPFTLVAGLKAGMFVLDRKLTCEPGTLSCPSGGAAYFGLSPQLGFEFTPSRRLILGLNYALDVPLGIDGLAHRVYLNAGWRFF